MSYPDWRTVLARHLLEGKLKFKIDNDPTLTPQQKEFLITHEVMHAAYDTSNRISEEQMELFTQEIKEITVRPAEECKGKIIRKIEITDDTIKITFDDCTLYLEDNHSCCESRYFTCDDPFNYWEGLAFIGYRVQDGPNIDCTYGEHECQFLTFETFLGEFTVACHNEHNGYYGGFNVSERLERHDGYPEE